MLGACRRFGGAWCLLDACLFHFGVFSSLFLLRLNALLWRFVAWGLLALLGGAWGLLALLGAWGMLCGRFGGVCAMPSSRLLNEML